MDDRLRQQLAAWLEFYRELGIEDFYRRPLGTPRAAQPTRQVARLVPAAESPPQTKKTETRTLAAEGASPVAPSRAIPPAMAPRSLSLFEAPPPPRRERETLEQIIEDLGDCQRCRLAKGRKTIVFGQGNSRAELVFVGEAPGADEDEQGLPFVGRAGQLLNRLIQFIGMKRQDVYICNIVKCRPPGNRTPEKDEVESCSPFLFRQIQAIQPRLVCCLGAPAVRTVLGIKEGITKIRGRFYDFGTAKALATVHPAYILRNPREEKILREDFEKIRQFLK
jgi:uracil-DNA glycosylase family 4